MHGLDGFTPAVASGCRSPAVGEVELWGSAAAAVKEEILFTGVCNDSAPAYKGFFRAGPCGFIFDEFTRPTSARIRQHAVLQQPPLSSECLTDSYSISACLPWTAGGCRNSHSIIKKAVSAANGLTDWNESRA